MSFLPAFSDSESCIRELMSSLIRAQNNDFGGHFHRQNFRHLSSHNMPDAQTSDLQRISFPQETKKFRRASNFSLTQIPAQNAPFEMRSEGALYGPPWHHWRALNNASLCFECLALPRKNGGLCQPFYRKKSDLKNPWYEENRRADSYE